MGFTVSSSMPLIQDGAVNVSGLYVTCQTHISNTKDRDVPGNVLVKSEVYIYASLADYQAGGKYYDKFSYSFSTNDLNSNLYTQFYNSLKTHDRFSGQTFVDDV